MQVKFSNDKPIFLQLADIIKGDILSGKLQANEKLPSVRDFALTYSINPNTVQKSYDLLEEKNVIYSVRGSGWYVEENTSVAKEVVDGLCHKKTDDYLLMMKKLGCDFEKVLSYLKERKGD